MAAADGGTSDRARADTGDRASDRTGHLPVAAVSDSLSGLVYALALFMGAALLGGGFALEPALPLTGRVLALSGAAILVFIAVLGRTLLARPVAVAALAPQPQIDRLGDRFERGIESLKDIQWELRENEARYRDLLDSQQDVILRRDDAGRLTFVNRSFCRVFGVEAAGVLGVRFQLPRLAGDSPAEFDGSAQAGRRSSLQQIETVLGARA